MNKRKIFGIVGAIILAGIGTVLLVTYVNEAEERALEGEEVVEVYAVSSRIDAGTAADEVAGKVELELVPRKVRSDDAVVDLSELEGLVAEIDLLPGEQLLRSRFVDQITFQRDIGRVTEIPPGLQEIALSLSPERAGGAGLLPGDTVAIFASFDPFNISSEVPVELDDGTIVPPNGSTPNTTTILLHKVLVTNVQLERLPEVEEREGIGEEEARDIRLAPTGNLLVSLAVDTFDGERLVFTAEFGSIWLSIQPQNAVEEPSIVQTRDTIYRDLEDLLARLEDDSDG